MVYDGIFVIDSNCGIWIWWISVSDDPAETAGVCCVLYPWHDTETDEWRVIFSGALLLVAAFGIATALYPWFARTVLKLQTKHAGIFSYGFSAVLLLLILVVSIVFGFRQSRRQAEIEVLRSGD